MASLSLQTVRLCSAWLVPASPITLATRLRTARNERGATAVEYGLLLALIAAAIITAAVFLGNQTQGTFDCTAASVRAQASSC